MLAALLVPLARAPLRRLRLLVSPDTVLRWHRDLIKRRHARLSVRSHGDHSGRRPSEYDERVLDCLINGYEPAAA